MWGCTLHAFYKRQPLPRNIHRVTDLTEKYFWGINLVISYRSATGKDSQTIILAIILAATVISRKQLQLSYKKFRINFPKITYHVLVFDSDNYMETLFGNYFLGASQFSYTK